LFWRHYIGHGRQNLKPKRRGAAWPCGGRRPRDARTDPL